MLIISIVQLNHEDQSHQPISQMSQLPSPPKQPPQVLLPKIITLHPAIQSNHLSCEEIIKLHKDCKDLEIK